MRVLVTGAAGQLGRDVVGKLRGNTSNEVVEAEHAAVPVEDAGTVAAFFSSVRPDAVIHCAALTDVDRCEREPARAEAVNAVGTASVARAAERVGAHLVCVSTDYVFDGRLGRPYRETDTTNPLSVYGATKLAGELACSPEATVVRTSWLSGAHATNFVTTVLGMAGEPGELRFIEDQRSSPTYTVDLAQALVALALDRRPGYFHVTNAGEASRFELARAVVALSGGDPERVRAISTAELHPPRLAVRPAYSVLDNGAFAAAGYPALPGWEDGLARLLACIDERAP